MCHSFNKFLYIGQDRNFLTPYHIIIRKWRYNPICEMPDYKYYRKMGYAKIRLTVLYTYLYHSSLLVTKPWTRAMPCLRSIRLC